MEEDKGSRMDLSEYVRSQLQEGEHDYGQITRTFIKEALASDDPIESLFSPIHGSVQGCVRTWVKVLEHTAGTFNVPGRKYAERSQVVFSSRAPSAKSKGTLPPAAARQKLMDEQFYVPGEGHITWAAATVEQHRKRIQFDESRVDEFEFDIKIHQSAIDRIEAVHGAKCLRDTLSADSSFKAAITGSTDTAAEQSA